METKPLWAAEQAEGEGAVESPPKAGPGTSFIEPPLPPPLHSEISALQWTLWHSHFWSLVQSPLLVDQG